ncbi:uncharacterized protein LOC101856693 [Aplysia californica]|uniref:Uncharacterized protein LOC101856693 n=1 Tax=Aplysia californica TaxID=6500 RepID=A0ABM0K5U7_APLCA|nr:uncharacterized protein LOC101856693 [Aplysia californica]
MTMFHLQYPASKDYFTWEELGCLCRALGFPVNLFQSHLPTHTDEIQHDGHGLSLQLIVRMLELNLLYKGIHRTFNLHTADWNACVLTRAIYMLGHRVLDFEGLHQMRVAYATYEHADMKGMLLDKHTLLRTLKMCGRTISPMKLMHRIKHMKSEFEEKGRIQLYEFFNLIIWCDLYSTYNPEEAETASGKEDEMFKLVDFQRLLSHHDERLANRLNSQYLREEWDFGKESLGSKEMFKEPPVYTEGRIAQALFHQKNYRQLKHEVGQSQKRVYRALAGTVRSRPISAPDLEKYRHVEESTGRLTSSAHEAYETVQRRLHSAPSRATKTSSPDRPVLPEFVRCHTPQVVTPRDLSDIKRKMENLQFDMNTLDARCQLQIENEMEFYIPGYLEKLASRQPEHVPVAEPERKEKRWSSSAVNKLAYPRSNLTPSHAKLCDARFRGWKRVKTRPGYHFVVTSQTHENSCKGRQRAKMEQTTLAPVRYLHPDYVVRYTAKCEAEMPLSQLARKRILAARHGQNMAAAKSSLHDNRVTFDSETEEVEVGEEGTAECPELKEKFYRVLNKYDAKQDQQLGEEEVPGVAKSGQSRATSSKGAAAKSGWPKGSEDMHADQATGDGIKSEARPIDVHIPGQANVYANIEWPEDLPVPTMQHSGPKLVGVGQIGTISLLESIEESRDLEEKFVESPTKGEATSDIGVFSDYGDDDGDYGGDQVKEEDDEAELPPPRLSKSQPSSQQKRPGGSASSRKSRSAPHGSRGSSPRRKLSLKKTKVGLQKNRIVGPRDTKIPSDVRGLGFRHGKQLDSGNGGESEKRTSIDEGVPGLASTTASACDSSSASPEYSAKFSAFRGSVTSEESEDSPRAENGAAAQEKQQTSNKGSSFSEDMNLSSPNEILELPESPQTWKSRADLSNSPDSGKVSPIPRPAPVIRFEWQESLSKDSSLSNSDVNSEGKLASTRSEQKDSIRICFDYRDYLSDSAIPKKTFSKETRSRLVSRVENVISPDLKMRLMAGDASVPVPAS